MKLFTLLVLTLFLFIYLTSCSSFQDEKNEEVFGCGNISPEDDSLLNSHAEGKALFQDNCASCHHPLKDATGPALRGALGRTPSKEWVYKFVRNPGKLIQEGDIYANELFLKWNKTPMTSNPNLTDLQIDAIMQYCDACKMP